MALRVVFATATGSDYYDAGTYAGLRMTSDTMYGLPELRVLGRDVNHRWITPGGEFLRLDIAARLRVYFEGGGRVSKTYGPFEHFSSADGIAYADRQVLAFADQASEQWFVIPEDARWAVLVAVCEK
jgi:hypothetical protein